MVGGSMEMLLMGIGGRAARDAEQRKLLLGVESDDARSAEAEEFDALGGAEQFHGLADRRMIEMVS